MTDPEPAADRRRRRVLLVVVALVVASLIAVGAVWLVGRGAAGEAADPGSSRPRASTSASAGPSGSASASASGSDSAWEGAVTAVEPTTVKADCTAPDAKDDGGATVRYTAAQAVDGDPTTAWRCDGDGEGTRLTLALPAGTTVAELGLVNGYTKVDPASKKDRYGEYRRVLTVTWTIGDRTVTQTLADETESLQTIRIPPTPAEQVVLRIDGTSAPGSKTATRDAVLISELSVRAPA